MSNPPKKKSSTDKGDLPDDTSDGAMRTHDVLSVGQKFRRATTSGPLFTNKWKEVSNGLELVFAGDAESECSLSITARGLSNVKPEGIPLDIYCYLRCSQLSTNRYASKDPPTTGMLYWNTHWSH